MIVKKHKAEIEKPAFLMFLDCCFYFYFIVQDYFGEVLTVESHGNVMLGQNASYLSDPNLKNNYNKVRSFPSCFNAHC